MSARPRRKASPTAVGAPQALQLHAQPHEDEEEDAERVRVERERRAGLYGRAEARKLPAVDLPPRDARARKDLQLLLLRQQAGVADHHWTSNNAAAESRFEREQQDAAKHREAAGWRPPMDRVHDLRPTVPKDLRAAEDDVGNQSAHAQDWALGSGGRNAASSGVAARGGVDGVFQPPEGAAQVYARTRHRLALPSALLAYPPRSPTAPTDALHEVEPHEPEHEAKPAWCPASYATLGSASDQQKQQQLPVAADAVSSPSRRQRFPLRSSASTPLLAAASRTTQQGEERCASRQRALLAKAADAYARLRRRVDKHKEPAKRYALPVEDEKRHSRAYRLGLDCVPSSSTPSLLDERHERDPNASPTPNHAQNARSKLEFRPKSAGCLAGFQPTSNNALKSGGGVAKVAGARRRPRSASITYLGRATVYCMAPASPSGDGGFGGELADERRRRREDRASVVRALATRGVFHGLALAQVFAWLRREALGGAAASSRHRRAATSSSPSPCPSPIAGVSKAEMKRAAALEQLSLDEFMQSCALPLEEEEDAEDAADSFPSVEAARESLVVSRAQFLAALEVFHHAVSARDANALFSAVEADVRDRARVCELVRAIVGLQREHERLRRARVQL